MTQSPLAAKKSPLYLVILENISIYEQLQLEEALLRTDHRNWCLINTGSTPAIVMGISGKPEKLIDKDLLSKYPIPLIKRFSGGGTVVIDSDTYFVSWICNKSDAAIEGCPTKIHLWTESFYQSAFPELNVCVRENDYVIGEYKIGGNAQYICKDRWLHHSSLLWNYDSEKMRYLLMPEKIPHYRQHRSHEAFLKRLNAYFPSKKELGNQLVNTLNKRFHIILSSLEEAQLALELPHRKATQFIEW